MVKECIISILTACIGCRGGGLCARPVGLGDLDSILKQNICVIAFG